MNKKSKSNYLLDNRRSDIVLGPLCHRRKVPTLCGLTLTPCVNGWRGLYGNSVFFCLPSRSIVHCSAILKQYPEKNNWLTVAYPPRCGGLTFAALAESKNNPRSGVKQVNDKNAPRNNLFEKNFYTSYTKLTEIKLITIGLASPDRIRRWAEKTLPNGKVIGQVTNANTLHHKTFKPQKGGLFCERIFGPLKDFECACGKIKKPVSILQNSAGGLVPESLPEGASSAVRSLPHTLYGASIATEGPSFPHTQCGEGDRGEGARGASSQRVGKPFGSDVGGVVLPEQGEAASAPFNQKGQAVSPSSAGVLEGDRGPIMWNMPKINPTKWGMPAKWVNSSISPSPSPAEKGIKRQYCPNCDVEYTWSIIRRYQLGYINLVSPVTHVWYLKATPSYLSILLDIRKKHLEHIVYCAETMTLENSFRFFSFLQFAVSATPEKVVPPQPYPHFAWSDRNPVQLVGTGPPRSVRPSPREAGGRGPFSLLAPSKILWQLRGLSSSRCHSSESGLRPLPKLSWGLGLRSPKKVLLTEIGGPVKNKLRGASIATEGPPSPSPRSPGGSPSDTPGDRRAQLSIQFYIVSSIERIAKKKSIVQASQKAWKIIYQRAYKTALLKANQMLRQHRLFVEKGLEGYGTYHSGVNYFLYGRRGYAPVSTTALVNPLRSSGYATVNVAYPLSGKERCKEEKTRFLFYKGKKTNAKRFTHCSAVGMPPLTHFGGLDRRKKPSPRSPGGSPSDTPHAVWGRRWRPHEGGLINLSKYNFKNYLRTYISTLNGTRVSQQSIRKKKMWSGSILEQVDSFNSIVLSDTNIEVATQITIERNAIEMIVAYFSDPQVTKGRKAVDDFFYAGKDTFSSVVRHEGDVSQGDLFHLQKKERGPRSTAPAIEGLVSVLAKGLARTIIKKGSFSFFHPLRRLTPLYGACRQSPLKKKGLRHLPGLYPHFVRVRQWGLALSVTNGLTSPRRASITVRSLPNTQCGVSLGDPPGDRGARSGLSQSDYHNKHKFRFSSGVSRGDNKLVNNIYSLSHRYGWEHGLDWTDFLEYISAPVLLTDKAIPRYEYRLNPSFLASLSTCIQDREPPSSEAPRAPGLLTALEALLFPEEFSPRYRPTRKRSLFLQKYKAIEAPLRGVNPRKGVCYVNGSIPTAAQWVNPLRGVNSFCRLLSSFPGTLEGSRRSSPALGVSSPSSFFPANITFSGAGLIQKLLTEFNLNTSSLTYLNEKGANQLMDPPLPVFSTINAWKAIEAQSQVKFFPGVSRSATGKTKTQRTKEKTELNKMDKQNRILLYLLNKQIFKLKQILSSLVLLHGPPAGAAEPLRIESGSQKVVFITPQSGLIPERGYATLTVAYPLLSSGLTAKQIKKRLKELITQRNLLIRRTKLVRKLFISSKTGQCPSSMILSLLPVLPPDLRPIVKMGNSPANTKIAASDLNRLYQKVIYRNERLTKFVKNASINPLLSSGYAPRSGVKQLSLLGQRELLNKENSTEIKFTQGLLQEAVDNLIQNNKSGVPAEKDSRGRALKSLSDILKGKQGRFRQYLLGKRVDYSGRSVIIVGPKLKIHQCGIPKEMALELFLPFLLKRILNYNLARTVVGAKSLIKQNKPLVWELLTEIMQVCPVLLNRAPTLHRLGIQAFIPKLVEGRAILLHPLVCSAFNADFDGDQMAVHVPITVESRAEAWKLMLSRNNLLSPATGEPISIPSQDMVLGCYYLTTQCTKGTASKKQGFGLSSFRRHGGESCLTPLRGLYFKNEEDVLKAYNQQKIDLHATVWLRWNAIIEDANEIEHPIEIRIIKRGTWKEINSSSHQHFEPLIYPFKKGVTPIGSAVALPSQSMGTGIVDAGDPSIALPLSAIEVHPLCVGLDRLRGKKPSPRSPSPHCVWGRLLTSKAIEAPYTVWGRRSRGKENVVLQRDTPEFRKDLFPNMTDLVDLSQSDSPRWFLPVLKIKLSHYIKTTPGKILFNDMIKNVIKKNN